MQLPHKTETRTAMGSKISKTDLPSTLHTAEEQRRAQESKQKQKALAALQVAQALLPGVRSTLIAEINAAQSDDKTDIKVNCKAKALRKFDYNARYKAINFALRDPLEAEFGALGYKLDDVCWKYARDGLAISISWKAQQSYSSYSSSTSPPRAKWVATQTKKPRSSSSSSSTESASWQSISDS